MTEQLGHRNPESTLRTYAHLMPQEETDLTLADFAGQRAGRKGGVGAGSGAPDGPGWPLPPRRP